VKELVGVAGLIPDNYKQHLLLFDRIASFGVERELSAYRRVEELQPLVADIEWLTERRIWFDASSGAAHLDEQARAQFDQSMEAAVALIRRSLRPDSQTSDDLKARAEDALARAFAIPLRTVAKMNAVPVTFDWDPIPDEPSTRAVVLQIVIKRMPLPNEGCSLEDIIDFRERAKSEGLFQSLRVWINKLASAQKPAVEVSDELEDLISRYERAMRLAKKVKNTGLVRTLVATTAEIAAQLVTFQWSKLATSVCEVSSKEIEFMRDEMNAPGREVAYIVRARERFGN